MNIRILSSLTKVAPFAMVGVSLVFTAHGLHPLAHSALTLYKGGPDVRLLQGGAVPVAQTAGDPGGIGGPS